MPLSFHSDRSKKFEQQYLNAKMYIVHFIEEVVEVDGKRVLEIGCGEGGVLKAFLERNCTCFGIDLSEEKIDYAVGILGRKSGGGSISFISGDIYDPEINRLLKDPFDIVILKDTIEHIYGHDRIMTKIKTLLHNRGVLFVAFPPWRMPYGGHQQMMVSKIGKVPYYHLLPRSIYLGLLRTLGETEDRINNRIENIDTRISINQFEKLIRKTTFQKLHQRFYLINPIYELKFGLKPRKQLPILRSLPYIRDFVTTTCYYLLSPKET